MKKLYFITVSCFLVLIAPGFVKLALLINHVYNTNMEAWFGIASSILPVVTVALMVIIPTRVKVKLAVLNALAAGLAVAVFFVNAILSNLLLSYFDAQFPDLHAMYRIDYSKPYVKPEICIYIFLASVLAVILLSFFKKLRVKPVYYILIFIMILSLEMTLCGLATYLGSGMYFGPLESTSSLPE